LPPFGISIDGLAEDEITFTNSGEIHFIRIGYFYLIPNRLYVDKKADLSTMTQEQAYELCSHLNGRILESLGASTPADAFVQAFGEEALTKLHLRRVEARLVAPKKAIK